LARNKNTAIKMETLEQLEKEFQIAEKEAADAFRNLPGGLDWPQAEKLLEPTHEKVAVLGRKIRMIKPYTLEPIPDYGDVMPLEEFIECCETGGFIDYDGHGRYVKDGQATNIYVYPSDVKHGAIRKEFDKIIWFNR